MPSFARAFIALPEHLDFISQAVETGKFPQQRSTSKCISVLDLPGHGHGSRLEKGGPGAVGGQVRPGGVGSGGEGCPDGRLWALPDGKEALMESRA